MSGYRSETNGLESKIEAEQLASLERQLGAGSNGIGGHVFDVDFCVQWRAVLRDRPATSTLPAQKKKPSQILLALVFHNDQPIHREKVAGLLQLISRAERQSQHVVVGAVIICRRPDDPDQTTRLPEDVEQVIQIRRGLRAWVRRSPQTFLAGIVGHMKTQRLHLVSPDPMRPDRQVMPQADALLEPNGDGLLELLEGDMRFVDEFVTPGVREIRELVTWQTIADAHGTLVDGEMRLGSDLDLVVVRDGGSGYLLELKVGAWNGVSDGQREAIVAVRQACSLSAWAVNFVDMKNTTEAQRAATRRAHSNVEARLGVGGSIS